MLKENNFCDYVKLVLESGKGGSGSVHFRREKNVPKGGPDGGDGGRGGHVIIQGDKKISTLIHLKHKHYISAEDGKSGKGNKKAGRDGEDVVIHVPLSTLIKDKQSQAMLKEIQFHEEEFILLRGGEGGLGNTHFKKATQQSPKFAQPGQSGKRLEIILELRLLADVGLFGFPNAGKSTLLATLTAAKPKIADYPFTTLTPNLGVLYHKKQHFIIADIPGIIEGASKGKGLGIRFLRHIEKNKILLFMIPATSKDIIISYRLLLNELTSYQIKLKHKQRLIVVTKIDLVTEEKKKIIEENLKQLDTDYVLISAVYYTALEKMKEKMSYLLAQI